jgi:hypothetical protein
MINQSRRLHKAILLYFAIKMALFCSCQHWYIWNCIFWKDGPVLLLAESREITIRKKLPKMP